VISKITILLFAFCLMLMASCCPQISEQETTERILVEVRKDTVFVDRVIPHIEITEPSNTFITSPSIETIDTTIRADGTLRDYTVKIKRTTRPAKVITGDSVNTVLQPEYEFFFSPKKPDSLFNEKSSKKTVVYWSRPWYEIPLFVIACVGFVVIGIFIGRKIK